MNPLDYFLPAPGQFLGLAAVLVMAAVFWVLGAGLVRGPRLAAADLFVGWGAAVAFFTLAGVLTPIAFTWLAAALWAAGVGAGIWLWRRGGAGAGGAWGTVWRIGVLALPLILLAAAMRASQWDEFSQWLPNAWFLLRFDGFPGAHMPPSPSVFPAYPYALPLVNYLASRATGGFVENAGSLFNLLILLVYGGVFLHMVARGLGAAEGWTRRWGAAALGILGVTVLSTTFVQKLVLTAYADSATAVVLAVMGVLGWQALERLREAGEGTGGPRGLAWQFGWCGALLLSLKQANLVLFVFLLGAMALLALRDPAIRLKGFFRLTPGLLLVPLLTYGVWRYHVTGEIIGGDMRIAGPEHWLIAEAFQVLARMALIASKKGAYFAMMGGLSVLAIIGVWRFRGAFDRAAVLVGAVFVGFNLFLWFIYVFAMGSYNGLHAVSYWRFNTQLGLLGCTMAGFGLAILWRRHVGPRLAGRPIMARNLSIFAIVLVLAAPLLGAGKLRFDKRPQKDHYREVGRAMAEMLPKGARVAVLDPRGDGFSAMVLNYELTSAGGAGRGLDMPERITRFNAKPDVEFYRERLRRFRITHAWLHEPSAPLLAAFGVTLAKRQSHLLERKADGGWERIASWAYDGYTDPFSLPD